MQKCGKCERGPHGMVGHDDLFVDRLDQRYTRYLCRACGTLWVRKYAMTGEITWSSVSGNPMEAPTQ